MHPITSRRATLLMAAVVSALLLAGCGNGDGLEPIPGTPQTKLVGALVDAPVEGVEYETTFGDSGITNADGEFLYLPNELVTFRIGGIELGTVAGAPIVTPVELTSSVDPTSPAARNMAVFLQSLDADSTPSNGISISDAVRSLAVGMSLNFSSADFETLVAEAIAMLTGGGNSVVDAATALENFYEAYVEFGGTDSVPWQFPGFPAVGGGVTYELVFADEFNEGSVPSPAKWNIETGYGERNDGWGNNEWQLYTDSSDNVRVEDGNLVIQARCDEPCGVRDGSVTSARINTLDNFNFRYGRIVARIKAPVGEGAWPAFWSLGSNFPDIGWPRSGEIDYMELFPSVSDDRTTHFAMHWCDETIQAPETCSFPEGRRFVSDELRLPEPLGDDYHIYEADWNENRVIGKIDGIPYFNFAINPATMEEFRRDFFMILNVAMGGTLGSDNQPPSGTETWPQTMLVDYVRVYQQTGGGGPAEDTLIDFEDAPDSYDFGPGGGFEGGASLVLDNPVPGGINTSDQVARMLKFSGQVFGGSLLTLSEPVEITEGGNVTMKVWSSRPVPVTFKYEGQIQEERIANHGGTGWEELTFDFTGVTGVLPGVTFIFDITVVGDATNNPEDWTFYYDDVLLPTASTDEPALGGLVSDFELNAQSYDFGPEGGFGGGAAAVVENPVPGGINTSGQVVRMFKFDAQPFGGALWSLNSPLTVPNGSSFSMKVWSSRRVPVLFKLEGGTAAETTAIHGGTGWELLTFDFPGIESVYTGITVIFDDGINGDAENDPASWTFFYDDITLIVDPDPDPLPVFPEADLDFERPASFYDFGAEGGFGGGAAAIVSNPVPGGINTSAQVGRMLKFDGEPFGGTTLFLPETVSVPANSAFRMQVWSPRVVDVTFKLEKAELEPVIEVVQTHQGTGWEELFFDFGSFAGDVTGITLIFDNGTNGDATNDPDNWTFYFDAIELTTSDDGPVMLAQIDLPITFDNPMVDYTVIDFGDPVAAATTLVADPDDASNTVASTIKPAGTPVWAGTTMSTQAGLASAIPFSATVTTIGVRVYSPAANLPVRLKADNEVNGDIGVEVEVLTTVAGAWETLVFDFADQVAGTPALDLATSYTALSIFFNFGTDGDTAGPLTFLWDDVEFGVPLPVVDETAPVLTAVSVASSNANPALARVGDVVTVTLTADEPITMPVVTIGGTAADTVTGADTAWQATRTLLSGDAEGTVTFSITATDVVGNEAAAVTATTDASSVTLDASAPTVSILNAPADFTTLAPFQVTIQFSEPVTGFAIGDITVTGGAASNLSASTSTGDTYTVNLTPNGSGNLIASIAAGVALDLAGNASEAALAVPVLNNLDADAPLLTTISIASSNADPTLAGAGDVVTITMIANEAIDPPTVTIAGAPADSVTGSGTSWTASRTMLATDPEGAIAFTINYQDVGGNAGPEATVTTDPSTVTFDVTAPVLTISGLPATIMLAQPIALTFEFDEDVSDFDQSDIAVTNGSVDSFVSVDAMTYTANVLPDGNGDLTITVAAGAASDAAGNGNAQVVETRVVDLQPFWNLVWSDDFDETSLDAANWTARTDSDCPAPCDEGQQVYDPQRATVSNGALRIEARNVSGVFTSGFVDTLGKRELTYGRIEIDARMPGTIGTAPSLLMLPVANEYGAWPASGEIDIVNAPGLGVSNQTLEHTLRYGLPVPEDTSTTVSMDAPSPADMNVLTYAIEWEGGEIRWFVDGTHVATQTQDNWYAYAEDADGVFTLGTDGAPFDQDFYLALSLALANNAGAGTYPQFLDIDAVRVYECANPVDPALGTGCSTGTGIAPVAAESEPYSEALEVYTDAPAVLDFVVSGDPGNPVSSALQPGSNTVGPGVTVNTNIAAADGANTVWNVDIAAAIGRGNVTMSAVENGSASGFFDLSGGETAGEILFRMRVTAATTGTVLEVGLNGAGGGVGRALVPITADNTWRQYSVKIADVVTDSVMDGTTLDLAGITDLFVLEARSGSITLDLDDIEVVVTCRDVGGCEATPRQPAVTSIYGPETFETVDIMGTTIGVGWRFFNNVTDTDPLINNFSYSGQAPNGPQICAIAENEGGTPQGMQQLSVYSDYECCNPNSGHRSPTGLVEVNVFREPRSPGATAISASDVGDTWIFSFDAKRGNIGGSTEHVAFFKVLNPSMGFSETAFVTEDMTQTTTDWQRYTIELTIGPWAGQLLQFGFQTKSSNFEPSGVFYDNLEVVSIDGP